VNQWVKGILATLGVIDVMLQSAYPHAPWAIAATAAITGALTALHVAPKAAVP
jgi:hypothetical protein